MGLADLRRTIRKLGDLRNEGGNGVPSRWRACIDKLEQAFEQVETKYELLCDRYTLLKENNSQLANELVWLRDQCDDLASLASSQELDKLASSDKNKGRRYTDQGSR